MQDRLYDSKYARWVLVAVYLWLVFCGPWMPAALTYYGTVNEKHGKEAEEPAGPDFLLPESLQSPKEREETERRKQQCARSPVCRVAAYHSVLVLHKTIDDPVALFTIVLAFSTIGLWAQTRNLAKGAEAQAADIQEQLSIARDDFVSTHRAWVAFTAQLGSRGIWYDPDGTIRFSIIFTCKNVGTTPALGASVNSKAYLYVPIPSDVDTQREICKTLSASITNDQAAGTAIFPGNTETIELGYGIAKADLDAYVAAGKQIYIAVAGCVDYEFAFGEHVPHQSGFIYYIGKKKPTGPGLAAIVPIEGNLVGGNAIMDKCRAANGFFVT